MSAVPGDWLYPPADGWTLADLQSLPEKSRVEVLDGALIVNPSPLPLHQRMVRRLAAQLETAMPARWQLETDIDVMLSESPLDYLTPDVVVFDARIPLTTRPIPAAALFLVVEVVSRGSRREDRGSKPLAYAEAGVPHFWRVESALTGALETTVHTFELGPEACEYTATGTYNGRVRLEQPFPMKFDLARLVD